MPITFQCGGCGKDYAVSDGLAGKRAACKACGHRMSIPAAPVVVARPVSPPVAKAIPVARIVERPTSLPRRDPIPEAISVAYPVAKVRKARQSEPPAEDIYGLDEAPSPLPPLMPRVGGVVEADPPVKKKKRKKRGFFSSTKPKQSSGGGYSRGEGLGGVVLVVRIVLALGFMGGVGGWFLASKAEVNSFHETLIKINAELVSALQSVRDAGGAGQNAAKVQGILGRYIDHLEKNGFRKGKIEDIREANNRFLPQIMAGAQQLQHELERLGRIPGAIPMLNIQGQLMKLQEVANRLDQAAKAEGQF